MFECVLRSMVCVQVGLRDRLLGVTSSCVWEANTDRQALIFTRLLPVMLFLVGVGKG